MLNAFPNVKSIRGSRRKVVFPGNTLDVCKLIYVTVLKPDDENVNVVRTSSVVGSIVNLSSFEFCSIPDCKIS